MPHHLKRIYSTLVIACASVCAVAQASFPGAIVVVCTPGNDTVVWAKLNSSTRPIQTKADLLQQFRSEEFILVEGEDDWYYLFDQDLAALRSTLTRVEILKALLNHASPDRTVRFGDLSRIEKEALLEKFHWDAYPIKAMGDEADNIRLILEISLYLEVTHDDKTIGAALDSGITPEEMREQSKIVMANAASGFEMTPERLRKLDEQDEKDMAARFGLCVRMGGKVLRNQEVMASKRAIDEFDKMLTRYKKEVTPVIEGLNEKFLKTALTQLGGQFPTGAIDFASLPRNYRWAFTHDVTSTPEVYGFADETEARAFLDNARTAKYRVEIGISYMTLGFVDSNGIQQLPAGHGIRLVLW